MVLTYLEQSLNPRMNVSSTQREKHIERAWDRASNELELACFEHVLHVLECAS